jgi:hypothetical protein
MASISRLYCKKDNTYLSIRPAPIPMRFGRVIAREHCLQRGLGTEILW